MGLLAVTVLLVTVTEPLPVDPMIYLEAAVDPGSAELNHWTTRLGIVLPVWLVSLVFGFSEFTYYALPIAAGFLFGFVVSAVGRIISGSGWGALAAPVALSGPMVLPFGSMLLPDVAAAAMVALSVLFILKSSSSLGSKSHLYAILAGLSFGGAYLVRETILVFGVALLVGALLLRVNRRSFGLMAMGAVVAPVFESVVGLILWGDPLARLRSIFLRAEGVTVSIDVAKNQAAAAAQDGVLRTAWLFIDHVGASWYGRALFAGAVVFTIGAVFRRSRQGLFVVSWALIPWILFALIGAYRPEPGRVFIRLTLDRYWVGLIPPLAIALVAAALFAARRLADGSTTQRFVRIAVTGVLVAVVGLGINASFHARGAWFMRFGNDDYWQLRAALSEVDAESEILVPARLASLVKLYTFDLLGRRLTPLAIVSNVGPENDPWVLFHDDVNGPIRDGPADLISVPADDLTVFAAERSTARWVLLTPQESEAWIGTEIGSIGSPDTVPWLARRVIGGDWGEVFAVGTKGVEVEKGVRLVVFDGTESFGVTPLVWPAAAPGDVIEIRVGVTMTGGRVSSACHFFPESGERTGAQASSMLTEGPIDGVLVSYCSVPDRGDHHVRPVLIVDGPATVQFGTGTIVGHRRSS